MNGVIFEVGDIVRPIVEKNTRGIRKAAAR